MRFFFYSHDGMGLGHVRRQIAIAAALREVVPDAQVLLATSVDEVASLGLPPNVDTLKLPGLRKTANAEYSSRRLGIPKAQMRKLRSAVLREAVKAFDPDVILVDKHPFGAGGELEPALRAAKAAGAHLVLGLRDILDDPAAVKKEWERELVQGRLCEYFDLVLIYGLRDLFDPIRAYELSAAVAARAKYCGYVVNQAECTRCPGDCLHLDVLPSMAQPKVLCTVGGGEDGFGLLKTFAQACADAGWNGIAITGPMLPDQELRTLRIIADDSGVTLQPFVACLSQHFDSVNAIVCMGGYNTLLEALCKGVPTVCVPRISPRSEQLMRALAFEKLGLLRVISPDQLTPAVLKNEISAALEMKRTERLERSNEILSFDGAHIAARHILALLAGRRRFRDHSDEAHEPAPSIAAFR